MLTQRQMRAAVDLFAELSEVDSPGSFISVATAGLHAALDIDVVAYCEWHPQIREAGWTVIAPEDFTPSAEQAHVWDRYHREDLWIRHAAETGDRAAVRLTDIASRADLSRSPTYQGTYRRAGFQYIAHAPLYLDPGTSAAVAIGRTARDLDDDVMYLFGALSKPLRSARHRAG